MKPIGPIYIKLLVAAVIVWMISTTIWITDLYLKVGSIEHDLIHSAIVGYGRDNAGVPAQVSAKALRAEELSILDSAPVPGPEPGQGEEIEDENIVDEDA